jgi:mono/diheme cytochrome c family protein
MTTTTIMTTSIKGAGMSSIRYLMLCTGLLLAACDGAERGGMPVPEAPKRQMDSAVLAQGEKLYQTNCAGCHGAGAEGAANWHQRDAQGNYPPPPLNGSGHAWHHSVEVLASVINEGSPGGKGNMPAWKGRLSAAEINAIIQWFQSLWPQPVYDAWFEMQQRGR